MISSAVSPALSLDSVVDQETGLTLEEWLKSELEVMLMKNGVLRSTSQREVEEMLLQG